MKAIDTNVIVRLIVRDDAEQAAVADTIVAGSDLLILPTVLIEVEWVLRSRYKLPRAEIAARLDVLCGQPNATVLSADAVAAALIRYAEAGDFADHLHLALAAEAGATAFVTFDRNLPAPSGSAIVLETL